MHKQRCMGMHNKAMTRAKQRRAGVQPHRRVALTASMPAKATHRVRKTWGMTMASAPPAPPAAPPSPPPAQTKADSREAAACCFILARCPCRLLERTACATCSASAGLRAPAGPAGSGAACWLHTRPGELQPAASSSAILSLYTADNRKSASRPSPACSRAACREW